MRVAVLAVIAAFALARPLPARAAGTDGDEIKVLKGDVKVEYKRFDPYNLPTPPPPVEKGEAAVTVYRFGVEVDSKYSYSQPANAPPGPAKLDVTVEQITVKLSLSITVWLPDNASKELEAHEEGHRWIAERYYADAERRARPMAQQWVGKKLTGEARDAKAAARSAIDKMSRKLCQDYLDAINAPCERAQAIFDKLTDHGRNVRPGSKEGMERALAEARKEEKR
jgi:hypothetical protein